MSPNKETNIEYRELDLTKSEDLEVFLESVEDVYADALEYEAAAKSEGYKSLADEDIFGSEIFETLYQKLTEIQELVSKCNNDLIPNDKEIGDNLVESTQQLYDDMILLRNHVREAYEKKEVQPVPLEPKEDEKEVSPIPVIDVVDLASSEAVEKTADEEVAPMVWPAVNPDLIKNNPPQAEKTIDKNIFVSFEQTLKQVALQVATIKNRSSNLFSEVEKTDDVLIDLSELDVCEKRIHDLIDRIESSKNIKEDESVLKNNLNRYTRVAAEIEKNAHSIEEVLLKKRSEMDSPEVTNESPKPENTIPTKSEVSPVDSDDGKSTEDSVQVVAPGQESSEVVVTDGLSVCGSLIPIAGPSGVAGARTLRETLMVSRDRNPDLRQHPEKQILVDKLIRKLAVIPSSGFDAKDIQEIIQLARAINVPGDSLGKIEKVSSFVMMEKRDEEEEHDKGVPTEGMKRKDMNIVVDSEAEGNIAIRVAKKTRQKFEIKVNPEVLSKTSQVVATAKESTTPTKIEPLVVVQDDLKVRTPVIAELEKRDPINRVVADKVPAITHPKLIHEETSLSRKYLNNSRYRLFIKNHYTSPAAFERMLDTAVSQIESRTVDALERFFGETFASPFAFMQEMSVEEIYDFSMKPDVRQELSALDIKYETFVAWIDLIDEMQEVVGTEQDIEFGELFARWIIETEISYYEVEEAVA